MMVEYDLVVYGVGKVKLGLDKAGAFTIVNELERINRIETSIIRRGSLLVVPLNIKKGGYGAIQSFEKGDILYDIPRNSLIILLENFTPTESSYAYAGKVLEGLDKLKKISRVTKAVIKTSNQEATG